MDVEAHGSVCPLVDGHQRVGPDGAAVDQPPGGQLSGGDPHHVGCNIPGAGDGDARHKGQVSPWDVVAFPVEQL